MSQKLQPLSQIIDLDDLPEIFSFLTTPVDGRGKNYLIANKGFDFTKESPSNMREIRRLALERLATWRYIQISNLLSI